ncbi:glycosyltransferase family 4 protein [Paenibacillaceae bacterium WGS1546]|uniref:glycosyltransferase family 4 protein n=1 Tax=Cohnella sp. WGS1546 TaxID=3366810 RepID=UPI00372CF6F0
MRNIAIDMRMINYSGIGTYLRGLVPLIIDNMKEVHFHLIGNPKELGAYLSDTNRISIIDCTVPIYSFNEQVELVKKIPRDTDLLWVPHYNIPIFYRGKMLVTVHDVLHLAYPQFARGVHKRMYVNLLFKAISIKANKVITVSRFSRNEIIKYTVVKQEKIHAIYNGVDNPWREIKGEKRGALSSSPYLLYVGNVKPHKNLRSLVKAFELIKDKIPHRLIIIGKKEGFVTGDTGLEAEAERLGDRIQFTGFVDNNALLQYYRNADMMVFPSLYEGFGLPPLEAMASGCPVLVSERASLPEVCGDAALYFNPESSQDISDKILLVATDPDLKKRLMIKGKQQVESFTWGKCAVATIDIINRILETK